MYFFPVKWAFFTEIGKKNSFREITGLMKNEYEKRGNYGCRNFVRGNYACRNFVRGNYACQNFVRANYADGSWPSRFLTLQTACLSVGRLWLLSLYWTEECRLTFARVYTIVFLRTSSIAKGEGENLFYFCSRSVSSYVRLDHDGARILSKHCVV